MEPRVKSPAFSLAVKNGVVGGKQGGSKSAPKRRLARGKTSYQAKPKPIYGMKPTPTPKLV